MESILEIINHLEETAKMAYDSYECGDLEFEKYNELLNNISNMKELLQ